jgi:hypothetical protein
MPLPNIGLTCKFHFYNMDTTYEVRAIVWPAKHVIKENLPLCFKKFYPYVRCTEVFIETSLSLDTRTQCCSDYKHHCTLKFLVAITPNGMFYDVSPCYGGRASDKFIFNNFAFVSWLEPNDQVMTQGD